jgi:hypothetical protein
MNQRVKIFIVVILTLCFLILGWLSLYLLQFALR